MNLYAVSDLHIESPDDPLYESLLRLIRDQSQSGDTLVLVGDVFDLFVGSVPLFSLRYKNFIDELRNAANRGVIVYYIEGNHDFLLKKVFEGQRGIEVCSSDLDFDLGGKRFLFSHGDSVNSKDYSYRLLKKFYRSALMRAFYVLAPDFVVDGFGKSNSRLSRSKKPLLPQDLPVQKLERLRAMYRGFAEERIKEGFDFVVMGHCHDLDEAYISFSNHKGQYINVGYPRVHRTCLHWMPEREKIERVPLLSS